MTVTAPVVQELHRLTELYNYNSVDEMIAQCTYEIQNNIIDIFVLSDGAELIGELHTRYQSDDDNLKAQHIYHSLGFNEQLLRKKEEYQGDSYEYSLYLMR